MDKNYRQYNKRASMDSIEVPDVDKIKKLSDKKFKGSGVNRTADEIFDGEKFNKAGEFDRATKTYDDPTKHKEEDDEDDFLEDAAAMPAQAAKGLSKGVKVGDSYVKRSKIIKTVVAVIIVLVLMVFFFPPLFFNDADKSVVRYDDNVFKTMGMTDFKTYALSNYSVYNEEAFGSEYDNAVCYATSVTTNSDGEVIGDTVPPFSSKEVTVRILVNITDMDDSTFDDCVTGMILSTKDMKKKIGKDSYLPCLPAFMPVSNATEIYINK